MSTRKRKEYDTGKLSAMFGTTYGVVRAAAETIGAPTSTWGSRVWLRKADIPRMAEAVQAHLAAVRLGAPGPAGHDDLLMANTISLGWSKGAIGAAQGRGQAIDVTAGPDLRRRGR